MTDFIARLDAAIGCQQCEGPLGASPSEDFCSRTCQTIWHEARTVGMPTDYQEPAYVYEGADALPVPLVERGERAPWEGVGTLRRMLIEREEAEGPTVRDMTRLRALMRDANSATMWIGDELAPIAEDPPVPRAEPRNEVRELGAVSVSWEHEVVNGVYQIRPTRWRRVGTVSDHTVGHWTSRDEPDMEMIHVRLAREPMTLEVPVPREARRMVLATFGLSPEEIDELVPPE